MSVAPRKPSVWPTSFILLLAVAAVGTWLWNGRVQAEAAAAGVHASMASHSAFLPLMAFGADGHADDHEGVVMGAPERMKIPPEGSYWTSPGPMKQSGFVVAWARLKGDFAATATGSISKDGSSWTEITRAGANANRSLPHLNLVVPVPEGYHFRLQLEGARGGGLEVIEASAGHWFPLSAPAD